MNIGDFTTWLGGSLAVVVGLLFTYWGIAWILKVAAAGKDWPLYVRNVVIGLLLLGWFGWTSVNWFYGQMKTGAETSPMTEDIVGVIGQSPKDFGLKQNSLQQYQPQQQPQQAPQQEQPQQAPQQQEQPQQAPQQEQRFPKPNRITFAAVTAAWPDGGKQDICGYDWTQSGNDWIVTETILCTDDDKPGKSVTFDPRTLTGVSGAIPSIPGNQIAVIQPPTPVPPPPTPIPTPTTDPVVLAQQCSIDWAQWAARMDLHNTRIKYGTDVAPIGVTCQVQSGKSFASERNEVWKLTCRSINVVDYTINGTLGRSIQGDRDIPAGSIFEFVGSGAQCFQ